MWYYHETIVREELLAVPLPRHVWPTGPPPLAHSHCAGSSQPGVFQDESGRAVCRRGTHPALRVVIFFLHHLGQTPHAPMARGLMDGRVRLDRKHLGLGSGRSRGRSEQRRESHSVILLNLAGIRTAAVGKNRICGADSTKPGGPSVFGIAAEREGPLEVRDGKTSCRRAPVCFLCLRDAVQIRAIWCRSGWPFNDTVLICSGRSTLSEQLIVVGPHGADYREPWGRNLATVFPPGWNL